MHPYVHKHHYLQQPSHGNNQNVHKEAVIYTFNEKSKIILPAATQMGLEITILNEVRKRKINTIYVIIYMWNLNIVKMNYLYGCQELRRRWESKELGVWDQQMQTVTITGWINNKVLPYSTGNYIQYPVINHNGKEHEKEYGYMCDGISLLFSRN